MRDLPRGTVTFLFTDIEGSTRLLKELGDAYGDVLDEHQRILREAFEAAGGQEIDTQGDSFFVAFPRAKDAVSGAIAGQRALAEVDWPEGAHVRVRMGLHTGEPTVGDKRYVGIGVHKAARIATAAHGGQILLSDTTRGLVEDELPPGVHLVDLGEHRLKDIDRPERVFQVKAEGLRQRFPPLRVAAAPRSRRWPRPGRVPRERALLAAAAALALTAAVVGIAVAMGRHEAKPSGAPSPGANKSPARTAPGLDQNTIVPGKSIGAVRLGMTESEVKDLYGTGIERQWRSQGKNGERVSYSGAGGALSAAFYNGKVVQIGTTSNYYVTEDGLRVGLVPAYPSFGHRLEAAIQSGAVQEVRPGVYAWRGFVIEGSNYCLRGNDATTQLAPKLKVFTGPPGERPAAARVGGIFITDADFVAVLSPFEGQFAGRGTPCAAQAVVP